MQHSRSAPLPHTITARAHIQHGQLHVGVQARFRMTSSNALSLVVMCAQACLLVADLDFDAMQDRL